MENPSPFQKGLTGGIPIGLGYLSVSFTFGMMAVENGLPAWIAVLISMTNLTSAGQFAGTALILSNALFLEIAVTTLVINLRYTLMSFSPSQKLDPAMPILQRCLLAFGNTDEIFAVAMQQPGAVGASYLAGLITVPYLGWFAGTLLGATATGLLPPAVRSALGIAIYGMFIAIIIPPACKLRPVAQVVLLSAALSCLFRYLPGLRQISSGWVVILCALAASAFGALRFPTGQPDERDAGKEGEA